MDPVTIVATSGIAGMVVGQLIRIVAAKLRKAPPQDEVVVAAAELADALAKAAADRKITAAELTVLARRAAALLVKLG